MRANKRIHSYFLILLILLLFAPCDTFAQTPPDSTSSHNCRFWGIVSSHAPSSAIVDQLLALPYSLDSLSHFNPNGWGIAYYADSAATPVIARGILPGYYDPQFDTAALAAATATPHVTVAHIRNCSSGLCNIPNPHPFDRIISGRHWLFGHNGTIDKDALLRLIRPDFLADNPPQYGQNAGEWIDSDLYFIFIMQALDDYHGQIKPALGYVIEMLRRETPGYFKAFNFFLTDGATIWSYCEGNTLCYTHHAGDSAYSAVASQPPTAGQGDWITMFDGQLVTLRPDSLPLVEDIETYFDYTGTDDENAGGSRPDYFVLNQNLPNPFNPSTTIAYTIPARTRVKIEIFNILGQSVTTLVDETKPTGNYQIIWNGIDRQRAAVPSGIYLYRLQAGKNVQTRKMILLR